MHFNARSLQLPERYKLFVERNGKAKPQELHCGFLSHLAPCAGVDLDARRGRVAVSFRWRVQESSEEILGVSLGIDLELQKDPKTIWRLDRRLLTGDLAKNVLTLTCN